MRNSTQLDMNLSKINIPLCPETAAWPEATRVVAIPREITFPKTVAIFPVSLVRLLQNETLFPYPGKQLPKNANSLRRLMSRSVERFEKRFLYLWI